MKLIKNWQYHHAFFFIGLIFGLKLVFVNPPWHANDEDRHFFNAYNLSSGHIGPQVQKGRVGFLLPKNLASDVFNFQMIRLNDTSKLPPSIIDQFAEKVLDTDSIYFHESPNCTLQPFPYIPAAISMKLGGIMYDSPVWLGWWGRIGTLLAYLCVCFLAIKRAPQFKGLLTLIALSPMALYQGGSITYDSLGLAFLFLYFAYLMRFYFQEEKITLHQIILLFVIAFMQRLSKDGYFLLFFCTLFLPIHQFEKKSYFWIGFGLMMIAAFLPSFLWNTYIQSLHLPTEKPLQNDFVFDMKKNFAWQFKNPLHGIYLIALNIFKQGQMWIIGSVGRFGFSYTKLPVWFVVLQYLTMATAVFTETYSKPLQRWFRFGMITLSILTSLAILFVFFLNNSPIGSDYLYGLQGRYFTPLLPFLIGCCFYIPQPITTKLSANHIKMGISLYTIVTLWYTVYFLQESFYHAS